MKVIVTESKQLLESGRRLDANYHASYGVQALNFVQHWGEQVDGRSDRIQERRAPYGQPHINTLVNVCIPKGIFIPSRFKRIFVNDPEHGAPYLTGSSIMQVDPLNGAKLLSYRFTQNMKELALHNRMILVTCSGTIGNSVYVNENFKNAVGSPDLLRIVADSKQISPGYLYAFLSSSLGRALIEKQTYGAVVPHIEAHHIFNLPIPRLNAATEQHIHNLIEQASSLRVEANENLKWTKEAIHKEVGFVNPKKAYDHTFAIGVAKIDRAFSHRLDSFCHVGYVADALDTMKSYTGRIVSAPQVGFNIYNPPLFKRMFASDGYPYMSGVEIYTVRPTTNRYLSRLQPDVEQYLVSEGTVLIQSAGQRYGLITTPVFVTRILDGVAATSDIVRIFHKDVIENGYICALFASDFGRRLALRYSYGTSIPRLNVPEFSKIKIPWPKEETRHAIGQRTVTAYEKRDRANQLEDQAQTLLAEALELTDSMFAPARAVPAPKLISVEE